MTVGAEAYVEARPLCSAPQSLFQRAYRNTLSCIPGGRSKEPDRAVKLLALVGHLLGVSEKEPN